MGNLLCEMTGRHVIASGGGGWSSESTLGPLERYILELTGGELPRVCLLATASGDSDWLVARFYEAFSEAHCRPSHLSLFHAHPSGIEQRLLAQDVIYVGGGSSANLMTIWSVHGVGAIMRRAWERGVVLSGVSAGGICWFASGLTNSVGPGFAPVAGLGLLEGGFCPHADSDPERLVVLRRLIEAGSMPATFAVDDGAAIHVAEGAEPRLISAVAGRAGRLLGPGGVDRRLQPVMLTD